MHECARVYDKKWLEPFCRLFFQDEKVPGFGLRNRCVAGGSPDVLLHRSVRRSVLTRSSALYMNGNDALIVRARNHSFISSKLVDARMNDVYSYLNLLWLKTKK